MEREKWREGRERRGGERERERGYRQRSPQVWGHDMFEQLEREEAGEEGEGEGEWGQEGWEGEEQEVGSGRQQRRWGMMYNTVEPPNNGLIGDEYFVHCLEVVPYSGVEMCCPSFGV